MSAVLAWARLDLRRRWRALVVLTLLVGLAGGVVLAAFAGARRTDTVAQRLDARIGPPTVMAMPNLANFDWAAVAKLPSVAGLGTFVLTDGAEPQGIGIDLDEALGFPAGDTTLNTSIERPVILSGRAANPLDPNEIVVTPGFIHLYGRQITIRLPTRAQAAALVPGAPFPAGEKLGGPVVHLHVVGVAINTFDLVGGSGPPTLEPTYAFFLDYIKPYFGYFSNALVRLKGGAAAIPTFTRQLTALTHDPNIDVVSYNQQLRVLTQAESFAGIGWLLFAAAALVASLILVGQAFVRFSAGATDDLRTLAALGLDRRQAQLAAASGPIVATLAGVVLAVVAAVAFSPIFPTGLARGSEPAPGLQADGLVLWLGALGVVCFGAVGAWWAAGLAVRARSDAHDRRSVVAAAARRAGLGVCAVLGTRYALEPGRGRGRVPVRPALVGAVAGVLGIVGALTFRVGLDATVNNPARFGQTFQQVGFVAQGGAPPAGYAAALVAVAHDPDVSVADDLRVDVLPVNGRPVSTFSLTPVKGTVDVVSLSGRPPRTASEVSLGPTTAKALHVHVGDTVDFDSHTLTVTGVTFVPEDLHNDYDDGAWLTTAGFNAVQPNLADDTFHELRFSFITGVNVAAATTRLPANLIPAGLSTAGDFVQIDQVEELRSVRLQPLLLGGFLLLLALGAVGHALAAAVRRRRRDMAVFRALGMTRRQTRLVIATQATVIALVGLVFGLPLGIAAGRSSWRLLADSTPALYVAPLAVLAVALAVPITVATANVLAAIPARHAARMQVGQILHTE